MTQAVAAVYEKDGRHSYFADLAFYQHEPERQDRLREHATAVGGNIGSLPTYLREIWDGGFCSQGILSAISVTGLPPATDSINVPKLLTGTVSVEEQDITDTSIVVPVRTMAGEQGVRRGLLETPPPSIDAILLRDLMASYQGRLVRSLYHGSGNGDHAHVGVDTVVRCRLDRPTPRAVDPGLWASLMIADAVSRVEDNRILKAQAVLVQPKLAELLMPFATVNKETGEAFLHDVRLVSEPHAGWPVGTAYVLRGNDICLWHAEPRARVLSYNESGSWEVPLLQLWSYSAFTALRYPDSICAVTGLTPRDA